MIEDYSDKNLENISIDNLNLSNRTRNCLIRENLLSIEDVLDLTIEKMKKIRNMGNKSIEEILEFQNYFFENDGKIEIKTEIDNRDNSVLNVIEVAFPELEGKSIYDVLYKNCDGRFLHNVKVTELNLSKRAISALDNEGYIYMNDIICMNYNDFCAIKALGRKTITNIIDYLRNNAIYILHYEIEEEYFPLLNYIMSEIKSEMNIYNYLKAEVKNNIKLNIYEINNLKNIYGDNYINNENIIDICFKSDNSRVLLKELIMEYIENSKWDSVKKTHIYNSVVFKNAVDDLINNQILELDKNDNCRIRYPYIKDWLATLSGNEHMIVEQRLEGKTLEEIGQKLGITRERVRQIYSREEKRKQRLREDDYVYWFEKYYFVYEDFSLIFDESETVFNYLVAKCRKGKASIDEMIKDENLTKDIYKGLHNCIYKDSIYLFDEYIPRKRDKLCKKLMKHYFSDIEASANDIYEMYNNFLKENHLDEIEELKFPSERAFTARFEDSNYILAKYGKKYRYYNIEECDVETLVNELHLNQFMDVEISTMKLFVENKDVMEEYGIKDEYELHNLLKKTSTIWNKDNKYNVEINRMPLMVFGKVDRSDQAKELLKKVAPVSKEDFCLYYEIEYGVNSKTVNSNFTQFIENYYHNGMYDLDLIQLNDEEYMFMKQNLTNDFYYLEDVIKLYLLKYPNGDCDKINTSTMKKLNYSTYSNYIISDKYSTSKDYFAYFITHDGIYNAKEQDSRFVYNHTFMTELNELRESYDILEYEDMKFITYERFKNVYPDYDKNIFNDYVEKAIAFNGEEKYFTVKYLERKGFEHIIDNVSLDGWFKSALIKNSKKLRSIKTGGTILFSSEKKQISTIDFIRYLLEKEKSMDIYKFNKLLNDNYGLNLRKDKIITLVKNTDMYYDGIMEKLYISKEYYYNEI